MTAIDDPVDATLIDRILGEYHEMPGLALTIDQAQRLWGCDAATARGVIDVLVARGVLQWSRDGRVISR
ncbi:MAG TPA: hypothetical protein VFS23_08830 [Vicinamibacterales bacterium]|nr:hypothetical protein [Vicinamibacterales bacterium]